MRLGSGRWKARIVLVFGVVLTDEIARPQDDNGKTGLLHRLRRGQYVSTVEGEQEVSSSFYRCRQDMNVLGVNVLAILLKNLRRRYGKKLPIDLYQQLVESPAALLGESSQSMEGLKEDDKGGLRSKPTCPAGLQEKRRAAPWRMGPCH